MTEYKMFRKIIGLLTVLGMLFSWNLVQAAGDPADVPGSKDPIQFTRMPKFHIYNYEDQEFDRYEFPVGQDKKQAVEGHHIFVHYYGNDGVAKFPSPLQVVRNYENAAAAAGGTTVYKFEDGGGYFATIKLVKNGAEVWAFVSASGAGGDYNVHVIEKQVMQQAVVADAKVLASGIRETGKVAVYGIYFDFAKSNIKPESDRAIAEIAKMLKADPKLKVYVVGHTDNVGGFESNVSLSKARAAAVVSALSGKYGIASARLTPFGAGATSPVASNKDEAGRAKNRRVELVQQ
jgi:outer membrane protein OmpA-like peptidoglycan-associated protein